MYKFNKLYKSIYLLSLLSFFMVMKVFPWGIFQQTPVSIIQFPFRFLLVATLLISVIATKLFVMIFTSSKSVRLTGVAVTLLGAVLAALWYTSVNGALTGKVFTASDQVVTAKTINGKSIYEGYYEQYSPAKAQPYMKQIEGHIGCFNQERTVMTPISAGKYLEFKINFLTKGTEVDLPIVKYKHSLVKINGQVIKSISSDRGTVQFKADRNYQKAVIKVGYQTGILTWIAVILSLLTWIWLSLEIIFKD